MKQLIIARKDLNMSPGKLAAQVSHASMCFLTSQIRKSARKELSGCDPYPASVTQLDGSTVPVSYKRADLWEWAQEAYKRGEDVFYARPVEPGNKYGALELCEPTYGYVADVHFAIDVYEDWIAGSFAKVVCEAKNKAQLLKAVAMAEELGLEGGKDFFLIRDNCYTELEPEETDENGVGRTLTCIGFRPLPDEIQQKISRKYQLYH